MKKDELLERYEALGGESDVLAARKPLYEQGWPRRRTRNCPTTSTTFGHASEPPRAVEIDERAIELDPDYDKLHYQLRGRRGRARALAPTTRRSSNSP